jgi:hypothetical protein
VLLSGRLEFTQYHTYCGYREHRSRQRGYIPCILVCFGNAPARVYADEEHLSQEPQRIHIPSAQQQGQYDGILDDSYLHYALCDDMHALIGVLDTQFYEQQPR